MIIAMFISGLGIGVSLTTIILFHIWNEEEGDEVKEELDGQ